jgi:hypothetical protein
MSDYEALKIAAASNDRELAQLTSRYDREITALKDQLDRAQARELCLLQQIGEPLSDEQLTLKERLQKRFPRLMPKRPTHGHQSLPTDESKG